MDSICGVRSTTRSSFRRTAASLFAGLVVLAGTTVSAQPAAAASTLASIPASGFQLKIDRATDYDAYGAAIRAVENTRTVTRVTPLTVARSKPHVGRPALCHDTGLDDTYKYDGFCWDTGDDNTSAYSTSGGWHPQGFTAAHDATGSTVDGHHLYLASWYYGTGADAKDKLGRISIAESTGERVTYGHVLLVRPTGSGSFEPITNIHADGMVWYGNKLFVANGGELLVFDMQYLWSTTAGTDPWVLPLQGRYYTDAPGTDPRGCSGGVGPICLGSLSLDRSSTPHALVSGEYRSHQAGAGGRIARWPLNAATDLPLADDATSVGTATATAAYSTPVFQMQGVATDGTWYYMAGECPTSHDADPTDTGSYSCIHRARAGESPSVLTRAPSLTQNLGYDRSSGRVWGLNEWTGHRVVFTIDPP
ncbi:hypothetical protein ACIQI7_01430 [Kitasatospora sp. NPDC092039]|uniref:hypothetical protein n=1 Tax=Kitasatospora sp. NPDC092039 TaxID=3364086 RepID=UPI003814EFD6